MIVMLAACAAVMASRVTTTAGPDTWYSLLAGRLIWHGGLPHHDTLTALTVGRTWVDQEWLGHLGIYGLFATGGWELALLVGSAGFIAAFAVSAAGARARGASDRSAALVALAGFIAGASNTELRAQAFAYVLFALTLALLLGDDRSPSRRVFLVLPLLVVWANVHGSVLVGAGLVALYGVISTVRSARNGSVAGKLLPRAAGLVLVPWLCVLASPYAFELPGYYRRVIGSSHLRNASSEWAMSTLTRQPAFFGLLIVSVVVVALAAWRGSLSLFPTAVLTMTAILGVVAVRNVVWFALAIAAILPQLLDSAWRPSDAPRRRTINLALVGGALFFAIGTTGWAAVHANARIGHSYSSRLAAAVSAAAKADPHAQIFADEQYADWLLYEDPALAGRIAYDIRYELLPGNELDSIVAFRFERGPAWQSVALPFGLLVLSPGGDPGAVKWFERRPKTQVVSDTFGGVVLRQRA